MDEFKVESISGVGHGIRMLRLSGPFTMRGIFEFRESVLAGNDVITIIDLTEVLYMDSAALGEIMCVHTSSLRHQRPYAVVGASERLRTLFKVAGVHKILVTYPTLQEALQAVGSQRRGELK